MRSNLLWLVTLLSMVAVVGRLAPRGPASPPSARYAPTQGEVTAAHALLMQAMRAPSPPERRLLLYNSVRDEMDGRHYGVLEAVDQIFDMMVGGGLSEGVDRDAFLSAIGGDRAYRGGQEEDWPRLVAFASDWIAAVPSSTAARLARARARLLSAAAPTEAQTLERAPAPALPDGVRAAIDDLDAAVALSGRHRVRGVRRLATTAARWACLCRDRIQAQRAFSLLGGRIDPLGWAGPVEAWQQWALADVPAPPANGAWNLWVYSPHRLHGHPRGRGGPMGPGPCSPPFPRAPNAPVPEGEPPTSP